MQAQQQYHQPQQQQHHLAQQQYHPQPQQQQPQHHQKKRQPPPQQQHHRNQPPQGHTTVDSRRSRQPLAPKSTRFELNSPWKDPNMPIGNRFHPNVVPYQDSYNVSPKGWGRDVDHFGEDNNIKDHYEYTGTSEKFQFSPAPRINKFNNTMTTPFTDNYNCRPKSWCDIELTASPSHRQRQPPPSRRAYPQHSQHNQSSVKQFTGQSSWDTASPMNFEAIIGL
ncbi:hypothetical protein BSL78_03605 [Apostichopus japonicus]|uniref:Uncharacterized protein n=1 Tax=Stichopus japonicus TaxID=307972 RepID=A0A2G8LGT2_STIJA|nr:hypothetical protein BSL78_03605 [Apostichopus japonicus]